MSISFIGVVPEKIKEGKSMKLIEKLAAKEKDIYADSIATVAFLGDSVTHGCFECYEIKPGIVETVFDTKNSYSKKFAHILQTLYPKAQLNVVNSGISGDSAPNGLKRLDNFILKYHPDLTVVCFGLNDSSRGVDSVNEYTDALDAIFKKLQENGSEVIFMTPNMMNTYASPHLDKTELFENLARKFGWIQNDGILELYVEKAKETAKRNGVKVCDCYAKWKKMYACGVDTTELLANYLNHPKREMHWLFATSLIETVFAD